MVTVFSDVGSRRAELRMNTSSDTTWDACRKQRVEEAKGGQHDAERIDATITTAIPYRNSLRFSSLNSASTSLA
jgi:hypothetical protein